MKRGACQLQMGVLLQPGDISDNKPSYKERSFQWARDYQDAAAAILHLSVEFEINVGTPLAQQREAET
jgi:hypothetical protein